MINSSLHDHEALAVKAHAVARTTNPLGSSTRRITRWLDM